MSVLKKKFIGADQVDGSKIKLDNNQYLRARNQVNDGDVNILKVDASDKIVFASLPQASGSPVFSTDLVTKAYLDSVQQGLKPKQAVRVATTGPITIATALNSGDVIDGITLADGDRVLVKDQASASENGIYVVGASPARASDFDSVTPIDEINGAYTFVQEGTANAGKGFVQSGTVATLGTDDVDFIFFNSAVIYNGADGITISGNDISVDHDGEGLQFVSGQLALELDGSTLSKSASGVKVADGGISNSQVNAAAAISYSKLNLASSIVNADIAALAAIAYSKLNLTGSIVDADVNASAAIAYSKLALSNSIVAGDLTSGSVTNAKIADDAVSKEKIAADVAGNGLGQNVDGSLEVNVGDGLEIVSDTVRVKVSDFAGAGLEDDGSNNLRLAASVAGDGLAHSAGVLSVNVDNATIELNADALRVKDLGITSGKLADDSVTNAKIADNAVESLQIASNAVTTAKIADANVTAAKLASDVAGSGLDSTSGVLSVSVHRESAITLVSGDITNQYIDLSVKLIPESIMLQVDGGPVQRAGVDYTISNTGAVTRITFSGDLGSGGDAALVVGDVVRVQGIVL